MRRTIIFLCLVSGMISLGFMIKSALAADDFHWAFVDCKGLGSSEELKEATLQIEGKDRERNKIDVSLTGGLHGAQSFTLNKDKSGQSWNMLDNSNYHGTGLLRKVTLETKSGVTVLTLTYRDESNEQVGIENVLSFFVKKSVRHFRIEQYRTDGIFAEWTSVLKVKSSEVIASETNQPTLVKSCKAESQMNLVEMDRYVGDII